MHHLNCITSSKPEIKKNPDSRIVTDIFEITLFEYSVHMCEMSKYSKFNFPFMSCLKFQSPTLKTKIYPTFSEITHVWKYLFILHHMSDLCV